MKPKKQLHDYPLRRSHSMHKCCVCNKTIGLNDTYYDGRQGRRAHVDCAWEKPNVHKSGIEEIHPIGTTLKLKTQLAEARDGNRTMVHVIRGQEDDLRNLKAELAEAKWLIENSAGAASNRAEIDGWWSRKFEWCETHKEGE